MSSQKSAPRYKSDDWSVWWQKDELEVVKLEEAETVETEREDQVHEVY